ncbi:MAG: hypothetical protein ACR2KB_08360 [Chitinophagaceae bacterium]
MKLPFKVKIGSDFPVEYDIYKFSEVVYFARLRNKPGLPSGILTAVSFQKHEKKWVSSNREHSGFIQELLIGIQQYLDLNKTAQCK